MTACSSRQQHTEGMKPAKSPSARTVTVPAAPPAADQKNPGRATPASLVSEPLPMPNERDQDVNMTPETPDPAMTQASKDVKRGVKDTSKGPEMDATYAKQKR